MRRLYWRNSQMRNRVFRSSSTEALQGNTRRHACCIDFRPSQSTHKKKRVWSEFCMFTVKQYKWTWRSLEESFVTWLRRSWRLLSTLWRWVWRKLRLKCSCHECREANMLMACITRKQQTTWRYRGETQVHDTTAYMSVCCGLTVLLADLVLHWYFEFMKCRVSVNVNLLCACLFFWFCHFLIIHVLLWHLARQNYSY